MCLSFPLPYSTPTLPSFLHGLHLWQKGSSPQKVRLQLQNAKKKKKKSASRNTSTAVSHLHCGLRLSGLANSQHNPPFWEPCINNHSLGDFPNYGPFTERRTCRCLYTKFYLGYSPKLPNILQGLNNYQYHFEVHLRYHIL